MSTATASGPQDVSPTSGRISPSSSVAWFVGLTLSFTVIITALAVGLRFEPTLLGFALAFAPAFIAIGLAWREGDGAVRRLLHQLTIRPERPIWYLVLLIPLASFVAVDIIAVALGQPMAGMFDGILPNVLIVPLVVLLPAFTEELAWRGFALSRTITFMPVLRAALVLGIPWTLIHVPLYLSGQMNGDAALWSGVTQVMSYSVVLAWVYVGTGGSVLMTGLFHTLANGLVPLTHGVDSDVAWAIRGVVWPVIAALVVILGGFRGLDRTVQAPALRPEAIPA